MTDAEIRRKQHEGLRGSGLQYEMEMWKPCDKKGVAQMGTSCIGVGRKNKQKEISVTVDPFQRVTGGHLLRAFKTWSRSIGYTQHS